MVEKKFKKHLLLTGILLLLFFFVAGILIGRSVSSAKINDVTSFLKDNELNTESFIVEQQLMGYFNGEDCVLAKARIQKLFDELGFIGRQLTDEKVKARIGVDNFVFLKRKYHLLQVRTYMMFKELSDNCDLRPKVILYYYAAENDDSKEQGFVLDAVVKNFDYNVFAIEFNYSKELSFLESYYNITYAPSVIINYDKKFEGFTPYAEIVNYIK
jgi:hypothetical protein